jgi:hypothetical protein
MTLKRFIMDLPIPEDAMGNLHADLSLKPTSAQLQTMATMTWLAIIKLMVRRLKNYAVDINAGGPITAVATAKVHECHHDEIPPRPCGLEEDI